MSAEDVRARVAGDLLTVAAGELRELRTAAAALARAARNLLDLDAGPSMARDRPAARARLAEAAAAVEALERRNGWRT